MARTIDRIKQDIQEFARKNSIVPNHNAPKVNVDFVSDNVKEKSPEKSDEDSNLLRLTSMQ